MLPGCDFQIVEPSEGGGGGTGPGKPIVWVESLGISTIMGGGFQEKASLLAFGLAAGDYRLVWSYNWNLSSTARSFESRIQIDDLTDVASHIEEPTDASGNYVGTGSGQKFLETGVRTVNLAGDIVVDLDWKSPAINVAASIWNVRLELWET